jgi:D-tyrosyl-tRNA(Tyr) deacylase
VRALLQRVSRAEVRVDGAVVGAIGTGLLVLVGVAPGDDESVAWGLAAKVEALRIFADASGRTNLSLAEIGGAALVVSQFTLYADASRGRRPSFMHAAGPVAGEALYDIFCDRLAALGVPVKRGVFGAKMDVELVNDGPFTVWLDSYELGIEPRATG